MASERLGFLRHTLRIECALCLPACQVALTYAHEEVVHARALRNRFNRRNRLPQRLRQPRIYSGPRLGAGPINARSRRANRDRMRRWFPESYSELTADGNSVISEKLK
jgi:hypothetical protein